MWHPTLEILRKINHYPIQPDNGVDLTTKEWMKERAPTKHAAVPNYGINNCMKRTAIILFVIMLVVASRLE